MERMELGGCCIEEKGERGEREKEKRRERKEGKFTIVWRRWRGGDCGSSGC